MSARKNKLHFHIVTLFPEAFESYLSTSVIGRALENSNIKVSFYNPRDFTDKKVSSKTKQSGAERRVDKRPYGGGPGMVLEALPVIHAAEKAIGRKKNVKVIFFSASGKQFTNTYTKTLTKRYKHIVLIAGRYEGIDARVKKILRAEEISIGPYILTGGELPAMVLIDSISRQLEGVLGNATSIEENRIASHEVYTRPEILTYKNKKYRVPKVLLSGDHKKIEAWRKGSQKDKQQ